MALIGGIAGAVVLGVDITCQIALGTTATGWILGKVVEGLSAAIKTVDPTLLAITALLDVIGVDQDTIELVKSIYASAAASIVMATVMIGAAVICSVAIGAVVSALSKTAAEEVTKEITSTIKSTIESIIKSVSKNIIKVLNRVCSMIQTSVVVLKLIAKISNALEKIGLLICETATSIMNYCVAENSADMAILQQDMSNLSKTREQMLSVLQRVDKTVEQEVSQMVRVLQHRTETLKFASHSIV